MNKHIIAATLIIGGSGVVRAWMSKKPVALTPIILGSYVFMLVLSLADMFGGQVSRVAGAIALTAVIAVILNTWLPLLAVIQKAISK